MNSKRTEKEEKRKKNKQNFKKNGNRNKVNVNIYYMVDFAPPTTGNDKTGYLSLDSLNGNYNRRM